MKLSLKLSITLAALLCLGTACHKAESELQPVPQLGDELITIRAFLPGETREPGAVTGISWTWSEKDSLIVTGETTEVFHIKEGFQPKQAEFVGKPVQGSSFSIAYPSLDPVDWSVQTQKGNNNADHLCYVAQLKDVDTYTTFAFTPAWAAEHGGSILQTGLLRFNLTFPNNVTSVSQLSLTAPSALFYKGNDDTKTETLTLNLQNVTLTPGETLVAWMVTSWNEATVPSGTTLTLDVTAGGDVISKELTFTHDATIKSGVVNTISLQASAWPEPPTPARYSGGEGTQESPWVITTAQQMCYVAEDLVAGETRYFTLGADIDLTGVVWVPLNYEGPFDKRIDFDGAGHTISNLACNYATYPGLFGVLYGEVRNLIIEKAEITASGSTSGILGGYGGTGGKPCVVTNVHVQGVVNGTTYSGGLFGTVREATITACSALVNVESTGQRVGGIAGYDAGLVTIRDCWTAGSVIAGTQLAGGIIGELATAESSVYNCFSGATVKAQFYGGGIVGRANGNAKGNAANNESKTPNNHIEKCIAWNDLVQGTAPDGAEHYSNGAIIGSTAIKNYLVDCYRKYNFNLVENPKNQELGYDMPDQENANPDTPLVKGNGTYNYGYYGKSAAENATLTSVAQALGWSTDIWDFTGDIPCHKNGKVWTPAQPQQPGDEELSGQLPDFEENVFYEE